MEKPREALKNRKRNLGRTERNKTAVSLLVQDTTISHFNDSSSLLPAVLCEARMELPQYKFGNITHCFIINSAHGPQNEV
jgi:hypothetical protein